MEGGKRSRCGRMAGGASVCAMRVLISIDRLVPRWNGGSVQRHRRVSEASHRGAGIGIKTGNEPTKVYGGATIDEMVVNGGRKVRWGSNCGG
ncbi:unnamed protein product [Linum trigynum]|uniref:Uncharacterized protein n=1 Tax=Linum trigynum TaxID=586398 RepID=A0AAV2EBN5_9ROSI